MEGLPAMGWAARAPGQELVQGPWWCPGCGSWPSQGHGQEPGQLCLSHPASLCPPAKAFSQLLRQSFCLVSKPLFAPWKAGLWLLSSRGGSLQPEARDWQVPPGKQRPFGPGLIPVSTSVTSGASVLHCRRSEVELQWEPVQHCIQRGEGMSP